MKNEQKNGTSRRGLLATLASLPVMAAVAAGRSPRPSRAAAKPDMIRQGELQHIIDLENEAERIAMKIRKRLQAGALIEPGSLDVDCTLAPTIEWFDEMGIGGELSGVDDICGLTVRPVEEIASTRELVLSAGRTPTRW